MKQKLKEMQGFTLAELLIVVAIIGVLTAIAIPVFTSQLEKSREATDAANLRTVYAEVMAAVMTETKSGATETGVTITEKDGTITASKTYDLKQTVKKWSGPALVGDIDLSEYNEDLATPGDTITITATSDGTLIIEGDKTKKGVERTAQGGLNDYTAAPGSTTLPEAETPSETTGT